jgi:uncharacterized membrane protein
VPSQMALIEGASARLRLGVSLSAGVVVGVLVGVLGPVVLAPLVGWDTAALIYLLWLWPSIWHFTAEQTARRAEQEDPNRAAADLLLLCAAVTSLLGVGLVIVRAGNSSGLERWLQIGLIVLSMVLSWTIVHTTFAVRYARIYYTGPDGGLDFHQAEPPRMSDFAYLSFTIGMTFQVSDTEVNDAQFRATILRHSLLSYLFGAVIIAITINLVAALSK